MEGFLQVTIVATTLTGILRSSRGRQQFYRRGKTSHMIMVQMLLHGAGTHPAEEQYLKFDAVC